MSLTYVSTLEGGSISDWDLTVKCGLINKDWSKEYVLMADRGFEVQDDPAHLGVKLNIIHFLKGKGQFEEEEGEQTIEHIKNYYGLSCTCV